MTPFAAKLIEERKICNATLRDSLHGEAIDYEKLAKDLDKLAPYAENLREIVTQAGGFKKSLWHFEGEYKGHRIAFCVGFSRIKVYIDRVDSTMTKLRAL